MAFIHGEFLVYLNQLACLVVNLLSLSTSSQLPKTLSFCLRFCKSTYYSRAETEERSSKGVVLRLTGFPTKGNAGKDATTRRAPTTYAGDGRRKARRVA